MILSANLTKKTTRSSMYGIYPFQFKNGDAQYHQQDRRNMNKTSRKQLQKALDKNMSCYVLITCGEPSEDGQMEVEMTYEGSSRLAAYLLHGAQLRMDQEEEVKEEKETYPYPSIHLVK